MALKAQFLPEGYDRGGLRHFRNQAVSARLE
ncbi:MAG: hypothetical protein ACI841_004518 [Planctomycetota bacterium]|jgi:hypothetical protein